MKIKIGSHLFTYKKDALNHYKKILNSYKFDESLKDSDLNDLLELLNYDYMVNKLERPPQYNDEINNIDDIIIAKVQYNTKCFEIKYKNKTSRYISYRNIINSKKRSPKELFIVACRNIVHDDTQKIKQKYFDENSINSKVQCQETGILSKWEDLVVDHRQPNTFSIIIDRFIELNRIELGTFKFITNGENKVLFSDEKMRNKFKEYHKDKAKLRIIRKERNLKRAGMARIKKMKNDFIIE